MKNGARTVLSLGILAAAAHAQGIPMTISCNGDATSPTGSTGTCTAVPFGPMTLAIDLIGSTFTAQFTLSFPNGAAFIASEEVGPNNLQSTTLSGTAPISAGTGAISWGSLIGASGSLAYALTVTKPTFTFTASGTLLLPNQTGSGYPISGPGGSVLPALCGSGSGCTQVSMSTGNFQLYEGSNAAHNGVLVLANPASSGSGRLTFEGPAGSGASVLTFEGSANNSAGPLPDASTHPESASSGSGLYILTPVGSTHASYSAVAACDAPEDVNCWISIPSGSSGTIAANSRTAIPIAVNPQGLSSPGTYRSSVAISITPDSGSPTTLSVPVNVVIAPAGPSLTLSQTGLQFTAESGSTAAIIQSVLVSNSGSSSMAVSMTASTLTGSNWLSVSPASVTVTPTTPAMVSIQVNPTGMAPGTYFGRVDFTAAGTTQSVVAMFTVSQSAGPSVSPAALTFVAPASGNPAGQAVVFSNPTSQPLTISLNSYFEQSTGWFGASATVNTATAAAPYAATVHVDTTGLTPGVYAGTLGLRVAENNREYPVSVLLIVPEQGASITGQSGQAAACTPTRLLPVFTNLEPGFTTPAGVPVPVQVAITDDCGAVLTSGATVMVSFSGSDTPVELAPLGNGLWTGTWMPHNVKGGAATVSVVAASSAPALYGSAGVAGTLIANTNAPVIDSGGAVWIPGTRAILISGSNLAAGPASAGSLPLPSTLGGTRVLLGGQALPLESVAPDRISAVLPEDAPSPSSNSLAVVIERNGTAYSMPEPVIVHSPIPRHPGRPHPREGRE